MLKHKKSMFSGNFKVLPIWNSFYFINLAIFGDFVAIFEKKMTSKKIFFFNFFFFQIFGNRFFEHNLARFEENFFLKISKKNFWKFLILEKVSFRTLFSISDWLYTHQQFVYGLVIMFTKEIFMWHAYPLSTRASKNGSL